MIFTMGAAISDTKLHVMRFWANRNTLISPGNPERIRERPGEWGSREGDASRVLVAHIVPKHPQLSLRKLGDYWRDFGA